MVVVQANQTSKCLEIGDHTTTRYVGYQVPSYLPTDDLVIIIRDSCLVTFLVPPRPATKGLSQALRVSRASASSGKAFNLDTLRARDMIVPYVEALENFITPLLRATAAGLPKLLSNPLFVLGHRLPVRYIGRC
jgi:hypothetical protein